MRNRTGMHFTTSSLGLQYSFQRSESQDYSQAAMNDARGEIGLDRHLRFAAASDTSAPTNGLVAMATSTSATTILDVEVCSVGFVRFRMHLILSFSPVTRNRSHQSTPLRPRSTLNLPAFSLFLNNTPSPPRINYNYMDDKRRFYLLMTITMYDNSLNSQDT